MRGRQARARAVSDHGLTDSGEIIVLHTRHFIMGIVMAALAAPIVAQAGEPRAVGCSVSVTYLLNGVARSTYERSFSVSPGAPFSDDFSTATRFRFFDAAATLEADGKTTTVAVSYFNDVGVLESVDFRTQLAVGSDRLPRSTSATHTYWSSVGIAGDHTTTYQLTCQALKD